MKTLCLNMIVKNESHVIKRCLDSVKPIIDYWVIFDTGSTDGTQRIIQEVLKDIPGQLHERPWVNFEHNRNEALKAARNKSDYLFFCDADEILVLKEPFEKSTWHKDFYMLKAKGEASEFFHPNIISNDPGWHWEGVLHECIMHRRKMDGEILYTAHMERPQDGARSQDPNKLAKDIEILQEAYKKEPWNARHIFYLAQSYTAAQDLPTALKYYEKRALMYGDKDELFWTLFRIGCVQEMLGKPAETIIASYCRAHQHTPYRAEPLERLASYYNQHKCPSLAYAIGKLGVKMRVPTALNSDFYSWVYEYGLLSQLADAAFNLNLFQEAEQYYQELLTKPTLSEHSKLCAQRQLARTKELQKKEELKAELEFI